MYIDFHTHKPIQQHSTDVVEFISVHQHVKYPGHYYTIGYHPWWTESLLDENQLTLLAEHLQDPHCIAIGECGLDKLRGADSATQEAVFVQQVTLAQEWNVPVIVHCVRQYDQLVQLRKKYSRTTWVVHGFRRNRQLAKSLIDQGIMLSVAPFDRMNEAFEDCLQYLPLDAFFLETDSDYRLTIQERYSILSELKKINIFDLQNQMKDNCNRIFSWKENNLIG